MVYLINNRLAVHGFDWDWEKNKEIPTNDHEYEEFNYGVITDPKFDKTGKELDGWVILDCRNLLDDWVNPKEKYEELIDIGRLFLEHKLNVVCCCSAGQSRSSSIALGILVDFFEMDFYDAWEEVKTKNPVCNIAMQHLDAIKNIYGVTLP
jgi:protein-tyrosine phosphatase